MTRIEPDRRRLPLHSAGALPVPFLISGSREILARDTAWDEHSHPTHELLWSESGTCTAKIGTRVWTITPSLGLWIPAGVPHSGWTPAGTWLRATQFSIHSAPLLSEDAVAVESTPLLRLLLDRLDDAALETESRSTTEAMVLDVLTPAPRELSIRLPVSPLLQPIVTAMRDDPSDATTLAAWAELLGVSTRTITRSFHAETGQGFSGWIATARARYSIRLLAQGHPIHDVAEACGYRSASAFGAAFRRSTGMTPAQFRSQ